MNNGHINWKSFYPKEFEFFVRDLLSVCDNKPIESFPAGPDGGIDLRTNRCRTIIQCKRCTSDFAHLVQELKTEARKEAAQTAQRYIIATSLALTPAQKKKIKALFPRLQSEEDILSGYDLENRLALHPEIRKLYPTLWLGDEDRIRTFIDNSLDRAIDHDSLHELQRLAENMRTLAPPPMTTKAMSILRKHRALIITGEPGIGKTTLAHYLISLLLKDSDYKFIFIRDNIETARQKYRKDIPQIFFYDDFLGTTFLRSGLGKNESKNISDFIEQIREEPNKFIIFTTREYIYQQAGHRYREFDDAESINPKLILKIQQKARRYKADILYKHLIVNGVPSSHIHALCCNSEGEAWAKDAPIFRIVGHPSFNPRVLERALSSAVKGKACDATAFPSFVQESLDSPYLLYERLFREHLSPEQQQILLMVGVHPEWTAWEKISRAVQHYALRTHTYRGLPLRDSLRVLLGDFLTTRESWEEQTELNVINPGIRDFIHEYLTRNTDITRLIIEHALHAEQLEELITIVCEEPYQLDDQEGTPRFPDDIRGLLQERATEHLRSRIRRGESGYSLDTLAAECVYHGFFEHSEVMELIGDLLLAEPRRQDFMLTPSYLWHFDILLGRMTREERPDIPWDFFLESALSHNFGHCIFEFIGDHIELFGYEHCQAHTLTKGMSSWLTRYKNHLRANNKEVLIEEEMQVFYTLVDFPDGLCGVDFQALRDDILQGIVRRKANAKRRNAKKKPTVPKEKKERTEPSRRYIKKLFEPLLLDDAEPNPS